MKAHLNTLIILLFCAFTGKSQQGREEPEKPLPAVTDSVEEVVIQNVLADTSFVFLDGYADGFFYNMKYAAEDNFLQRKVYECDKCLIRREVADALVKASIEFRKKGFFIKFFDCYRPLDVQKSMWEIYPDARYVANPNRGGSIHNKGGAVDITLVDQSGKELDMGTGFDFFGKEAAHAYSQLPDTVLRNRVLLKRIMESSGFSPISSEWWHYNFKSSSNYKTSNFKALCE